MYPALLKDRAQMLTLARKFFYDRNILEVDTCALSPRAAIDSNIDVIDASVSVADTGFLHTSPEYAMKRLLANGSGDIYFLGHVFRKGEIGSRHSPEFTMAEWYRVNASFEEMIQETCDFLFLFFGTLPIETISYRDAFHQYVGIEYKTETLKSLQKMTNENWDRDTCIHYLLTHKIEPHLGKGCLTILTDYPPHEAALACIVEKNGEKVAERFEIYYEGVELANGYHELRSSQELRNRFHKENAIRLSQKKPAYLLDVDFLAAIDKLPDTCGVSVGFDRAFMLKQKANAIQEILPFAWIAN